MANETHIGRRSSLGIGIEATAGTVVNADFWIPKMSGMMTPDITKAEDTSAYGVIDPLIKLDTVKNKTMLTAEGIMTDDWIGYLLYLTMGTYTRLEGSIVADANITGGTPARGDSISDGAAGFTGTIKKIITYPGNFTAFYFELLTGTYSGGTITDGTWTATSTTSTTSQVRAHFFSRLNTNDHPTATIYDNNPIQEKQALYGMIEEFGIAADVGDYVKFNMSMQAKKMEDSATPQTVAFTDANRFRASDALVYFAANEAALNAASATALTRATYNVPKNLYDHQDLGDEDIATLHNQQFGLMTGEFTAKFTSETLRDYVILSTERAMRIEFKRDDLTDLYGSLIYPSFYIDIAKANFRSWSQNDDNNGVILETIGYDTTYDTTTAMQSEILLLNGNNTNYDGS